MRNRIIALALGGAFCLAAQTAGQYADKNTAGPTANQLQLKQSLKGGEANVAYIEDVPPGEHRIAVVAKNISGEVIDRKEVRVVNVEAATSASGDTAPAPPPPPAPAPESAQAQPAPSEQPVTAPRETLPATASPYPAVLLAGSALLAAGLILSRKA
jgi:hypothetical protein